MEIQHPDVETTECSTYACTLAVEDHQRPDEDGQLWHYDESTEVHWPTLIGDTQR